MARTKAATKRRLPLGSKIKQEDGTVQLGDVAKRKHRWRPGTVALRDIRKYQRSTNTLIPKLSYQRLVRELLQDTVTNVDRLSSKAIEALQEGGEKYLSSLYAMTNTLAIHSGRVTITPQDLRLAADILNGNGTFAEGLSVQR